MCIAGFNVTVHRANIPFEDGVIGVIATMMWHGFTLLITDDIAQLLRYFDACPKQLSPLVCLVCERAELLESYFQVHFVYKDIIRILHVTDGVGSYCLRLTVQWTSSIQTFIGMSGDYDA